MVLETHGRFSRLVAIVLLAALAGCAGAGMLETVDSLMREGQDLYAARKYDEAIAKFEKVIAKDPNYWRAHVSLAQAYTAKGSWPLAITSARKAYQLAPSGQGVVGALGEALWGGGTDALRRAQFSEAIGHLTEYIRLNPTDPKGYLNAGKAYLGTGAYGDALSSFMRGLAQGGGGSVRQDLVKGLLAGGTQALGRGDARSAIGLLSEYIRHDTANFAAYLDLGKAYWQSGERFQALGNFRRALELNPGNPEALQFLQGLPR